VMLGEAHLPAPTAQDSCPPYKSPSQANLPMPHPSPKTYVEK
jgi:hypothetical protein